MSRIVSVWLKSWSIARLLRTQASGSQGEDLDPRRPLALVAPGKGGQRIVALSAIAQENGLAVGELLSNARSKVLDLQSADADPAADAAALQKLALWCLRYTPLVASWDEENRADGLFLDITGCAHLFGGEAQLLADLAHRLHRFGLATRLAVADTAGASWAVARYSNADKTIVPSGEEKHVLRPLPLAALRLPEDAHALLHRLGFRRIGQLMGQSRAPFAARFGEQVFGHLDQALGEAPEPLKLLVPPPVYRAQVQFVEPILTQDHVLEAAKYLLHDLAKHLAHDDAGARVLRLILFRVDGGVFSLDLGLAAPSRDVAHVARLIALRLDGLSGGLDADFGFEAASIHVLVAEPLPAHQARLGIGEESISPDALPQLIDKLQQRLGAGAVKQLHPYQSHIPERAVRVRPAASSAVPNWAPDAPGTPRPVLLLPRPEAAEVMALVPDGPPRQFRWRGILHQVAEAQGPERITPEWWRMRDAVERDYYVVEDHEGRHFWLYRAGLYDRGDASPQWFVHGVFA